MRSKLFVPASRPELFAKAWAGEADAISFDLEDAVAENRKPQARAELLQWLRAGPPPDSGKTLIVRVNAIDTPHFAADLDAIVCPALHMINLPMVDAPDTVRQAAAALESLERARGIPRAIGILANIESPRGLRLAAKIATAHPRVTGLQIGYGDLFAPLGIRSGEPSAIQAVRMAVRMAAGEAGIDAYDGAYVDFSDREGFRRDSQAAQKLGFAGRSCIHPSQIATANDIFRPGDVEVAHALRVVTAATEHLARGVGAFTVDGRLVDGPFITQAQRLVGLARRLGMIQ
ncbi:CoA ester lyase [Verticiella sediminum]|uniref:CoA ester lyase n=1 Tax=Verticiella sediminum TaxID=1247510 RepID=A0A556AE89_9BURK|nr:CoA ester lyase [Verticiella sediminum]TSH91199.1 CoA ester lyase [Verticiella sediminum]